MAYEFTCGSCGATLRLKTAISAAKLQCPKCGKKTLASKPGAGTAPPPAAAPALSASPGTGPKSPPATDRERSAPSEDVEIIVEEENAKPETRAAPTPQRPTAVTPPEPSPPVPAVGPAEQASPISESQAEDLKAQLREMAERLRQTQTALEVAELRAEQALKARDKAAAGAALDRHAMEEELSAHYRAEIDAAKKIIADLEAKLAAEQKRRIESGTGGRSKADIEKDLLSRSDSGSEPPSTVNPDALIADIKVSPFLKGLRASVLIHALAIGLTSIGYIVWLIQGKPEKKAPDVSEGPAATVSTQTTASAATAPAGKPLPEKPAAEKPASPTVNAGATSAAPAPKSVVEKEIESLPSQNEMPKDTSVRLDLDR